MSGRPDRDSLFKQIDLIANSNSLSNVVLLPGSRSENINYPKLNVLRLMEERFLEYRLNKVAIQENNNRSLYLPFKSRKNVALNYVNPHRIDNSSFEIVFPVKGKYDFSLEYGVKADQFLRSDFCLTYVINDKKEQRRLVPGNNSLETIPLNENDRVRFSFSGRLPNTNNLPYLKIYAPDRHEVYFFNIDFIKILPLESMLFVVAVVVLFILLVIRLVMLRCFQFWKLRETSSEGQIPGGQDEKVESEDSYFPFFEKLESRLSTIHDATDKIEIVANNSLKETIGLNHSLNDIGSDLRSVDAKLNLLIEEFSNFKLRDFSEQSPDHGSELRE